MNDRELLERAARAAGLKHIDYTGIDYDGRLGIVLVDDTGRHCGDFSPLTDDGDALRLAVKLRINLLIGEAAVIAEVCSDNEGPNIVAKERGVSEAATRRAIVRAAAEMCP